MMKEEIEGECAANACMMRASFSSGEGNIVSTDYFVSLNTSFIASFHARNAFLPTARRFVQLQGTLNH